MKKILDHPRFGEITIQRTRRTRRISLSVRPPAKVRLTMPPGMPLRDGISFIDEKEEWIAATLEKVARKYPVRIIEHGYRTQCRELSFIPSRTDKITARIAADRITVTYPEEISYDDAEVQSAAREAIIRALRAEAKEILPAMVEELAQRHGFRCGRVTVRATTSRWGSCSPDNNISLSIFLLCVPRHLCEYVILHELCHTKHKDHSDKFHRLLDSLTGGDEKQLSRELHEYRTDIL